MALGLTLLTPICFSDQICTLRDEMSPAERQDVRLLAGEGQPSAGDAAQQAVDEALSPS